MSLMHEVDSSASSPLAPSQPSQAGLPKYRRLANELRRRIETGALGPGEALPSEAVLCRDFELSKLTVRQALKVLKDEGIVDGVQGRGHFVREKRLVRRDPIGGLRYEHARARRGAEEPTLFEAMTGTTGTLQVDTRYERTTATESLAEAFGVEPGEPLLLRRYFYVLDGAPHQLVLSYLRAAQVDGTSAADPRAERPGRGTMHTLYEIGVHVDAVTLSVRTRMPNPDEAELLAIRGGTPVFDMRRRMLAAGTVVELSDIIVPGDLLDLAFDVDLGPIT